MRLVTNRVKQRTVVHGMFGLDRSETAWMVNTLLRPYGLKLKVRRTGNGDESAVEVVKRGEMS